MIYKLNRMALNPPTSEETTSAPPKPDLRPCARSYTDFHDAAILVLRYKPLPTQPEDWVDENSNITNHGFDRWYGLVERGIHDAAHNEYKYGSLKNQEVPFNGRHVAEIPLSEIITNN